MSQWVPLAGRQGGTVPTLVVSPDFPTDRTVFAASHTGVFRSRDGGRSWEVRGEGIGNLMVQPLSLALSPSFGTDHTLYCGTADGGIYRSTDAGDNWALLASPGDGYGFVALASGSGAEERSLMAGASGRGVFASTDGGHVWESRNSGLMDLDIIALALSPAFEQDQTAFVATEKGLHRTGDAGENWEMVLPCTEGDSLECVVVSPDFAADRTVFVGTEEQGVLRSSDGGTTWHSLAAGLPDLCVNALSLSPNFASDRVLAAATGRGVALLDDRGDSWRVAAEAEIALSVAAAGRTLLAGLFGEGIIRSEDGGASWEATNRGLDASPLIGLVLSPSFNSDTTLFTWGSSEAPLRSTDGGQNWEPAAEGLGGTGASAVVLSPDFERDSTLYATTSEGLFISTDRGTAWRRLGLEDHQLELLALSPTFPQDHTMVAATTGTLHLSTDGGESWSELEAPVGGEYLIAATLAIAPDRRPTLLIGTWLEPSDGSRGRVTVWRRFLDEAAFVSMFSRPADTRVTVLAVPDSYGQDQKFFIGNGDSIYRLVPNATERTREGIRPLWLPSGVGRRGYPVVSMVAAPDFNRGRTLFASGGGGVYISRDGAHNWQNLAPAPGNRPVVALALSPDHAGQGTIYALTLGGQLWRWDLTV